MTSRQIAIQAAIDGAIDECAIVGGQIRLEASLQAGPVEGREKDVGDVSVDPEAAVPGAAVGQPDPFSFQYFILKLRAQHRRHGAGVFEVTRNALMQPRHGVHTHHGQVGIDSRRDDADGGHDGTDADGEAYE